MIVIQGAAMQRLPEGPQVAADLAAVEIGQDRMRALEIGAKRLSFGAWLTAFRSLCFLLARSWGVLRFGSGFSLWYQRYIDRAGVLIVGARG